MCLRDTSVSFRIIIARNCVVAAGLLVACVASGQTTAWKRVAGTTINEDLAGAASGPVDAVWYAPGGRGLLAQTQSGRIFETGDFVHWRLNTTATAPSGMVNSGVLSTISLPEDAAKIQAASGRLYAAGASNLY